MTKNYPAIYSLSIDNMKQKIEDLISLGYSKEEILKMTLNLPSIYGLSIDNMKQKIEDLINLGYTKEEVLKMTKNVPTIYSLSIETMKQKIEEIITLGYTKQEVIYIIKNYPTIFALSTKNLKEKIDFYNSIQMHELPIVVPKNLMQSIALTYARYMFFKDIGINIDMSNYNKLFINNSRFKQQYGLDKKELLEKYNYEKDKENTNGRVI